MTRNRTALLIALLLSFLFGALLVVIGAAADDERPNIILVIADDLGWPYTGFTGDPIVQTPHIDALAAAGVTFDFGHTSSSVCQPSLMTLFTGLEPHQWDDRVAALKQRQSIPTSTEIVHFNTLARELETVGYRTFQGGKYWEGTAHMGGFSTGTKTEIGTTTGETSGGAAFGRQGIQAILDFLDDPSEKPFFAWFAPMLPHMPYDAATSYRAIYEDLGLRASTVNYYANTTWLDDVVGELLGALDARGLRDDTLIVFMSDNGWEENPLDRDRLSGLFGDARGKLSINELGVRTPVVFHQPGTLIPDRRRDLLDARDVFKTILDYAEASAPAEVGGMSIRSPIETGEPVGRDRVFGEAAQLRNPDWQPGEPYVLSDRAYFVRTDEWRYIYYEARGSSELFHISVDPVEDVDVIDSYPLVANELHDEILNWLVDRAVPPETFEITGTVVDSDPSSDEAPVGGIRLLVRGQARDGRNVRVDARVSKSGFFRIGNLPAGPYTVTPKARGMRFLSAYGGRQLRRIQVTLPFANTSEHLRLRVALTRPNDAATGYARIRGSVASDRGEGIAATTVSLRDLDGNRIRLRQQTDSSGAFLFEGLPPGTYRLRTRVPKPYRLAEHSQTAVVETERDAVHIDFIARN